MRSRGSNSTAVLTIVATLSLSACAAPPPLLSPAQVSTAATGCGFAQNELAQDRATTKLLLAIHRDPTELQRACVRSWAQRNGLKPLFLNMTGLRADVDKRCQMIGLLAASWTIALARVDATYLPAININGEVSRVVAVTVEGKPELFPPLQERLTAEGWKAHVADQNCFQIDTMGHSLDEVTGISFRLNNGEFGDLKPSFVLRSEKSKN